MLGDRGNDPRVGLDKTRSEGKTQSHPRPTGYAPAGRFFLVAVIGGFLLQL
jgi:hypothetical protein